MGSCRLGGKESSEAQITKLDNPLSSDENISWLNIYKMKVIEK